MNRVRHHRRFILLLSALALLAQVLVPVTHAMLMAQRDAGIPKLVFCAPGADPAQPQLAAAVAVGLVSLEHGKTLQHKPACSICASAHAAQLAIPPALDTQHIHATSLFIAAVREAPIVIAIRLLLPPPRGPPRHS